MWLKDHTSVRSATENDILHSIIFVSECGWPMGTKWNPKSTIVFISSGEGHSNFRGRDFHSLAASGQVVVKPPFWD